MDNLHSGDSKSGLLEQAQGSVGAAQALAQEAVAEIHRPRPAAEPPEKKWVIPINNVHNVIGVWHQQQYEKLGINSISIGKSSVSFELKHPVVKSELFTDIGFGKTFAFNFSCRGPNWTLNDVRGLQIDDDKISSVKAGSDSIEFDSPEGHDEYGRDIENYIRALFDPLLRCQKPAQR